MTRDEILSSISTDDKYLAICRKVTGKQADRYAMDLFQELFIIICELPDQKLQTLAGTCLHCFYYRIAEIQYKSNRSAFHKTNRKPGQFTEKHSDDILAFYDHSPIDPDVLDKLNRAMGELPYVDGAVLKLYADSKSIKQVSKDSGVPIRSLYKIIANARQNVRIKIKRYNRNEQ